MSETHAVFLVPSQYPTVQEAVDAAMGPTTIVVFPGVYAESVSVRDKSYLVIQSSALSRRGVTLCGSGGTSVIVVVRSGLYLSGIELRSNQRWRGIWAADATVSMQECVVAGNRVVDSSEAHGAGMACWRSTVHIQKSLIASNVIAPSEPRVECRGGGLYLEDCAVEIAGSTVQGNEVYSDLLAHGGGVFCRRSRMRMWRSRVTDNALRSPACAGGGIYFQDAGKTEIGGSVISGNGMTEGSGGGLYVDGNPVGVHTNTLVRVNYPDDLYPRVK